MRRVLGIALTLVACSVGLLLATGASDGGASGYKVTAIFNNAFSVIPGEDLKIAGVKVGKIESLDVTADQKAAVVLRVDQAGFGDWRTDATCTIRPQSLIGEKFVECTPTQSHPVGTQPPPLLPEAKSGPYKGTHVLPATQTSRPIDIDLLNNILRLPYRERLSIILNELGTGLAGRGADLNQVIRNADPALKETDKVLVLLANENKTLRDLARDSDAALAPLARERAHVADFVTKAGNTAQATAEKRVQFEQNLQKLPAFLRQLKPTMIRLGELSDEMSPVLEDLGAQAPAINRFIISLGPFSKSATPSLTTLGDATVPGRKALIAAKPISQDLQTFGTQVKPLGDNLAALLTSFRDTGGIERLMDYLYYQVAAINGFDSYGHYLRAQLIVNTCTTYAIRPNPSCTANFQSSSSARAASSGVDKAGRSPALVREDEVLHGESVAQVLGLTNGSTRHRSSTSKAGSDSGPIALPPALLPGGGTDTSSSPTAPAATSSPSSPQQSPSQDPARALLNYLLGGGD
jgi:phospholipid/cholesterol/gamma-HCH transport system substrate-binding protein